MSTPTGSTGGSEVGGSKVVLVRTGTADPVAALGAASWAPGDGPLLAVLATVPRERLERRLAEAGVDPEGTRFVEFLPPVNSGVGSVGDAPERGRRDITGLSMELVGRFDALAEEGGVVYLDALEPFVSAAGVESAFRFLVIVAARARAAGVPLVGRLDPDAVDPVVAATLAGAFDRVVERPDDGGWPSGGGPLGDGADPTA